MKYNLHSLTFTHFKWIVQWLFNKFTELYNSYQNLIFKTFPCSPKITSWHFVVNLSSQSWPKAITDVFSVSIYLNIWILNDGVIQYAAFSVCSVSCNIMSLSFIYVTAYVSKLFLLTSESFAILYIYIYTYIYLHTQTSFCLPIS